MNKRISFDKIDLILLCYVALLFGFWCFLLRGYPLGVTLDDGWIHLSFARNLSYYHVWSINPSEGVSGGSSSILWVLLLAVGYLFTDNGVLLSYFYNFLLLLGLVYLLRRLLEEVYPSYRVGKVILGCFLIISAGNLFWFAFSGMETLLLIVFGLSCIYFASHRKIFLSSVFSFLISLVRPEGIILALIVGFSVRRRSKDFWWIFASGVSGFCLMCFCNYCFTGTMLPSTLIGRRWIIGVPMSAELNPLRVVSNFFYIVGVWCYRLLEFTFGQALLYRVFGSVWLSWVISGMCGIVCAVGFVRYLIMMKFMMRDLFVWSILSIFAYSVMMPTRGHGGRYQGMIVVFAMLCFVLGVEYVWRIKKVDWRNFVRVVIVFLVLASLSSNYVWFRITGMSMVHLDRVHISAARWISENTPADAKVAGFDIGALSYFGGREVIDLGGLIDPEAGRAMYEGKSVEYMESKGANYLEMIFPYTEPDVYMKELGLNRLARGGRLRLLKEFHIDILEPYWPGEAERLLTNTIKVYKVQ